MDLGLGSCYNSIYVFRDISALRGLEKMTTECGYTGGHAMCKYSLSRLQKAERTLCMLYNI